MTLQKQEMCLATEDLELIFNAADVDGDGFISYEGTKFDSFFFLTYILERFI